MLMNRIIKYNAEERRLRLKKEAEEMEKKRAHGHEEHHHHHHAVLKSAHKEEKDVLPLHIYADMDGRVFDV
jgi:hypothetical protein